MSSSDTLLRWLCWALAVFIVVSAVLSIGIALGVLTNYPNVPNSLDYAERLAMFRAGDQAALPVFMVSDLAGVIVFAIATVLGVALRPYAAPGSGRDVMAVVFILGGIIGVISQLAIIGVNQTAAQGYCDCGYKAEELIAQTKALDLGFTVQAWLAVGALTSVGIAAALAGWLVNVSPVWRTLSYGIAIALIVAALLQVIDQGQYAQILTGVSGIFVAIWAIMLARAVPGLHSRMAASSAAT